MKKWKTPLLNQTHTKRMWDMGINYKAFYLWSPVQIQFRPVVPEGNYYLTAVL